MTLTASGGTSYLWSNGETTSSITVSASGNYSVTATNAARCSAASAVTTVTVNPLPSAAFAYATGSFCKSGINPTPSISGEAGGTFSSGTGLSLDEKTGAINLSASTAGTYVVTYTVSGTCSSSATASITITDAPVATFTYGAASYCTSVPSAQVALAAGATVGTFSASPTGLAINAATGEINPSTSLAGTYVVTNTIAASNGCAVTSATTSVSIKAVPVIVTQPLATTVKFGEQASFTVQATGTGVEYQWYKGALGSGSLISGATNSTYTISSAAITDADEYYVLVTGACSSVTSAAVRLTVDKATATLMLTAADLTQTYDGTGKTVIATVSPANLAGVSVTYARLTNGVAGPASSTLPVDAGSYQVVARLSNDNYAAEDVTNTLVIKKADQNITVTTAAPSSAVFGSSFTVAATSSSGLVVTYASAGSLTNNGATYTMTRGTGTGTVKYSQAGNENYNEAPEVIATVNAVKADQSITITTASPSSAVYNTSFTVAATASSGLPVSYGRTGALTNSGASYTLTSGTTGGTVTYNQAGNENYNAAPELTAPVTALKANATLELTASDLSQLYTGTGKTVGITTDPANLAGVSVTYARLTNGVAGPASSTLPVDAGSYQVVGSLSNDNYAAEDVTNTLVIDKAVATLALGTTTFTYTGSPKAVTVTTTPSGLSGVAVTYNGSSTTPAAAGTYDVVASLSNPNYTASDALGKLTIEKALATVTLGSLSQTYTGNALAATASTSATGSSTFTYTYSQGGTPVIAPTNAGSYAVEVTLHNDNFTGSATGTLVIGKAAASVTLASLSQTYDATAKAATASTTATGASSFVFTYLQGGTVVAAPTNAGSYNVLATLNNANYSGSATGVLVINKADASNSITLSNLVQTYNGSAKSASATTTVTGLSTFTFAYSQAATPVAAPTNAGSYTVEATLHNDNFTGSATSTLVIGKATATIAFGNTTQTYTGSPLPVTATTTPANLSGVEVQYSSASYASSTTAPTNAGTYAVAATLTHANYELATSPATTTLVINKANQSITVTTAAPSSAVYNTSFTVAATASSGLPVSYGRTGSLTNSGATYILTSGTTGGTVTYNQAGNENYNAAPQLTASVTATKANQTITWANPAAIVYGTPLSNTQLNATVAGAPYGTAAGALTYTPASGTVLNAGSQTLRVDAAATDNYNAASKTVTLQVDQQTVNPVADTYYTGSSFYWTTSSSSNTATLNLVTTLKTNPNYSGNITTARASFFIRNGTTLTPINGAQNLPVGLVNPGDLTTGTAAANVQYSISGSTTILNIAVVVTGNYKSINSSSTDKEVTVAVPTPGGQIAGGGKFDATSSAGYVKGSAGFAFYVQYNKSLKNPQGGVEVTVNSKFDRNGIETPTMHTYKLKSNAISVLATTNPTAQFSSKANIAEIVNGVAQSIEGNCTMQLDMYDGLRNASVTAPAAQIDSLAITVYRSNGGVWYSSKWNGVKTVRRTVAFIDEVSVAGAPAQARVTAVTTSSPAVLSTATSTSALKSVDQSLEVYPNPMSDKATVRFTAPAGGKAQVYLYNGVGSLVSTLYNAEIVGGHEYTLPLSSENLPEGVYMCRLIVNGKVENKRVVVAH
ncbi:MBG domain-containing protein [Hymenobacter volaticus]|uniref:MBG domain-containing protein n=1 Tax=Hymenobacter volaticus TaxID=2932254 RepID=A0ABY4G5B2_9BACT|nr:MBG domain-containing protein [Hymenobacter volaticus]UOQ66085.1 MBG domain-containing protein [Hymenobacter volaticus]